MLRGFLKLKEGALGRPRHSWNNNNKMVLKEIGWEDTEGVNLV
jgi:hypothetical protein